MIFSLRTFVVCLSLVWVAINSSVLQAEVTLESLLNEMVALDAIALEDPSLRTVHSQPSLQMMNPQVELSMTQLGGHMSPVTFYRDTDQPVQPYYISPWQDEPPVPMPVPVLVPLRGDFFCMPFGGNTEVVDGEKHPPHGETAGSHPGWAELPEASCDLILLVDVYHEFSKPEAMLTSMKKALKPHGQIVLVEFRAEDDEVPIKPEHKMSKAQVTKEMNANGLVLSRSFDKLPWQHMMWFEAGQPASSSTNSPSPSK
jgi:hypothetical protein